MKWTLVHSGQARAQTHMDADQTFLNGLQPTFPPILHNYEWLAPSLTYGYFIEPDTFLNLDALTRYCIDVARRPTGGGIVFHLTDLAFSVLIPSGHPGYSLNTLDNYAWVNNAVLQAVHRFLGSSARMDLFVTEPERLAATSRQFCMANPTRYDVMLNGRKIGGAAQRRTKTGLLHQGTLNLANPDAQILRDVIRSSEEVVMAMNIASCPLLGESPSLSQLADARKELRHLIYECLQET